MWRALWFGGGTFVAFWFGLGTRCFSPVFVVLGVISGTKSERSGQAKGTGAFFLLAVPKDDRYVTFNPLTTVTSFRGQL